MERRVRRSAGIYDRNGTPICEGDICKIGGELHFVEWRDDRARWCYHGIDIPLDCICGWSFQGGERVCVVGNVYDNQELLNDKVLELLWERLADIPMNPKTERIERSYFMFPTGTNREEIWHWFDERYSGGVAALMYGEE